MVYVIIDLKRRYYIKICADWIFIVVVEILPVHLHQFFLAMSNFVGEKNLSGRCVVGSFLIC